jgi:hypothetical protein
MTEPVNTDPRHGKAGRQPTAAALKQPSANADPGLFGKIFDLPAFTATDAALTALANAMRDPNPLDPSGDNPNIPSGFTYLGQFVDHDITLDFTSISEKQEDPNATTNFRTPRLDLDNVYGLGPDGSPQLYARDPGNITQPGPKLLIGKTIPFPPVQAVSRTTCRAARRAALLSATIATMRTCSSRRRSSLSSNFTTKSSTRSPPAPTRRRRTSSSPRHANR